MAKHSVTENVEAPSRIEPGHVQNRYYRDDAGRISNRKAWSKLTPLQCAYEKAQLAGGDSRYTEFNRLTAGLEYSKLCDQAQAGSKDSTQALERVAASCGSSELADVRADAIRKLARVDAHMGARDRKIIRMVCGEAFWPSQAVREVCGRDYTKAVAARFREALDALIEAIEETTKDRKRGRI